jgi:hypothetical protein
VTGQHSLRRDLLFRGFDIGDGLLDRQLRCRHRLQLHSRDDVMKRSWNGWVWGGFGAALLAALSYVPVLARFPLTRDFPWVNLLLFLAAGWLLGKGLRRAFRQPEKYRGKVIGTVFSVVSLALFGLFSWGVFVVARALPPAQAALRVGQRAPDFTLSDTDGRPVTLTQLRQGKRAVLLIFYRGYW